MALEKAGDIVRDAYKKGVGVPAFNVLNNEMIKLVIHQAEVLQKPVLIACYPGFKDMIAIDVVADVTKAYAKKVKVPVGLHLDHSTDYAETVQAMNMGYSSVMYDGSALSFEENVKNTAEVVKVAKTLDVDVEAELGHVGSAEEASDFSDSAKFTSPKDAAVFLERTECSSLAVAVGNAHGSYVQQPNLDLDRIQTISKMLQIPLVLHGGSGIPDEQIKGAIRRGIAKINVGTELFHTYFRAMETYSMCDTNAKGMHDATELRHRSVLAYLESKINLMNPILDQEQLVEHIVKEVLKEMRIHGVKVSGRDFFRK